VAASGVGATRPRSARRHRGRDRFGSAATTRRAGDHHPPAGVEAEASARERRLHRAGAVACATPPRTPPSPTHATGPRLRAAMLQRGLSADFERDDGIVSHVPAGGEQHLEGCERPPLDQLELDETAGGKRRCEYATQPRRRTRLPGRARLQALPASTSRARNRHSRDRPRSSSPASVDSACLRSTPATERAIASGFERLGTTTRQS
jgi:hypothetical protein